MPTPAVSHINTGTELPRLAPSVPAPTAAPHVLTARTQNAETAMVQAANDSMPTYGPATALAPVSSQGPYTHRNLEYEKEIERLQSQLDVANDNAKRNFELMKQRWDEQQLKFKEAAARFQMVAGDEAEARVAKVTAEAIASLARKDDFILRLKDRAQTLHDNKMQEYKSQQQKYEEDRRLQAIEYQSSIDTKVLGLLSHSKAEHASEKQNLEQEARQIIDYKQKEILEIQEKARERMQQIHDDAQRLSLQQENKHVQLQADHQQLADELKARAEETMLYKQQHDNLTSHMQHMQQQYDNQIAGLLKQLAQTDENASKMSSDAGFSNSHADRLDKQIQELRRESANKDAQLLNFQHEQERQKLQLNSALEKEQKFKSEKIILCQQLFDTKTKLDSEGAEIKSLQTQIKELLIAKECPPPPQKFNIASPRMRKSQSSTPVPKLDIASIKPEEEEGWADDGEYEQGDFYEEDDWEEEWGEDEGDGEWQTGNEDADPNFGRTDQQDSAPHRKTLPKNALAMPSQPEAQTTVNATVTKLLEKQDPNFIKNDEWITFDPQPKPGRLKEYRTSSKLKVGSAVRRDPPKGLEWWSLVDRIIDKYGTPEQEEEAMKALEDSGEFKCMDIMIANSLWTTVKGDYVSNLRRKNDKLIEQNKMLNGRQIFWHICIELRRSSFIDSMEATEHFMKLVMRNDNLQGYLNAWTKSFENLTKKPDEDIMVWKFYTEIAKSEKFKPTYQRHQWSIDHEDGKRDFETLWKMVETHIHQERKKRNDNQEKEPSTWGLAAYKGKDKGKGKAKGGKGTYQEPATGITCPSGNCRTYFWKGNCPKLASGTCEYKHDVTQFPEGKGTKGGGKGKGKGKEKGKGKGKDKGKGKGKEDTKGGGKGKTPNPSKSPSRGTSPSGERERMPCKSYAKDGICKRPDQSAKCKFWHPPVCPFERKGKGSCREGDKCNLLHFEKPSTDQKKAAVAALPAPKAKAKAKGAFVAVRVMHPDRIGLATCICRAGIADDLDIRHCINARVDGSEYCGLCTPEECSRCACGPCEGSPEPGSSYNEPSTSETSEGPPNMTSSSSDEPDWIPANHKASRPKKPHLVNQFGSQSRLCMKGCKQHPMHTAYPTIPENELSPLN